MMLKEGLIVFEGHGQSFGIDRSVHSGVPCHKRS